MARCRVCSAFTYDATGLSDEQLRRLVLDTEGRVLNRLVLRTDGRVMSHDCGHGTAGRPLSRWWIATLLAALALGALAMMWMRRPPPPPLSDPVLNGSAPGPEATIAPQVVEAPPSPTPMEVQQPQAPPTVVADGVRLPPPRVDVHLAELTSSWSLVNAGRVIATPSQVAADLEQRLEPLRDCYLEVLMADPNYRGTLHTTVVVGDTGEVTSVSMPLMRNRTGHDGLKECCEAALQREVFPWGHGTVTFKLVFAGSL
ncbi:MAG: hypothetical protein JNJ54_11140 [Myxococcaceae bacterium]|nr:hypothetical protein [Myxococcaceae bacterium]